MIPPFDRLLLEWRAARARFPEPPQLPAPEPDVRDLWALATLDAAIGEIGRGELPGKNNLGPDVARYCHPHGDGFMWCSGFAGWCIGRAAARLEIPMLVKKSLTAKTLAANIAAVGHRFDDWRLAKPGDFWVFHRGVSGGHIVCVEGIDADLGHAVEGNHGPLVCRNIRQPDLNKERFAFGASLRLR